jgi:hypothetical protein
MIGQQGIQVLLLIDPLCKEVQINPLNTDCNCRCNSCNVSIVYLAGALCRLTREIAADKAIL